MSGELIAIIAIAILLVLLAARVPVGFSLLTAGIAGLFMLNGFSIANTALATETYTAVAKSTMVVIPMFILMGMFAMESGVAVGAFRLANKVVGKLPGGLGIATVLVCAVFAAVSGSSPATVATVGRITIPEMRKAGYSREFTAGIIGTAGTLGVLIPPSIVAVVFGVTTEVSIGKLLIGGILPGVVSVLVMSTYIVATAIRHPEKVNDRSYVSSRNEDLSEKSSREDLYALIGVGIMFVVVIGGIYTGLTTATESAAFGALAGLSVLIVAQIKKGWRALYSAFVKSLKEAAATTTMIFVIMIGASVFTNFLVRSGATKTVADAILGLGLSPYLLVLGTLIILIPLGMFLETVSIILITMPILWPMLESVGVNGVWLGIMTIIMIEIGLMTPPVGINAFVLTGIAEDITLGQTFKGLTPFVLVQLVIVGLIFSFPGIVTLLPSLMR
ncbi:TRAP transporter large permease subunit [Actinomyces sp. B33]|uniref:TRAP transporter large permease n=1 Tax=Actinomyces sp. B33 TaxID=2942131 RepID=UPI002340F333|nr:TRAP transporter large permease subunit [Actinomyces sp. B33]MDC4233343.1 TRAP transporter large permease subunit [Actinomyces sp. B33]